MPLHGGALLLCHEGRGWGLAIGGVLPTLCARSLLALHVHDIWLVVEQYTVLLVIMSQMSAFESIFGKLLVLTVSAPVRSEGVGFVIQGLRHPCLPGKLGSTSQAWDGRACWCHLFFLFCYLLFTVVDVT